MAKNTKKKIASLEDLGREFGLEDNEIFATDADEVREEFVEFQNTSENVIFDEDDSELDTENEFYIRNMLEEHGMEDTDEGEYATTEEIEDSEDTVIYGVTHEKVYDPETDSIETRKLDTPTVKDPVLIRGTNIAVERSTNENLTYDDATEEDREQIVNDLLTNETAQNVRDNVIAELEKLYSLIRLPYVRETWDNLPTQRLIDLLDIVKKDNGGSIEVATLIRQTEDDFATYLNSDIMKSRLRFIDQKGSDYAKVAQKLSDMMGNDVVISGIKVKEYHQLLKDYTKVLVSIFQKINDIAEYCNIDIPVNLNFPNGAKIPVLKDMPLNVDIAMYVLNVVKVNIGRAIYHSQFAKEELPRAHTHIEHLKNQLKVSKQNYEGALKEVENVRAETRKMLGDSSYWIIKDDSGNIIRKKDPEKALENPRDLDLKGTIDTALFITTARSAEILVERLSHSRRFRNVNLNAFRVSIVQQTNFVKIETEDDDEDEEVENETVPAYEFEELDDMIADFSDDN